MAEIEFTINNDTGEMEMRIDGVQGPACSEIADKVKEVMGAPTVEQKTADYYARPHINRQVQGKGRN